MSLFQLPTELLITTMQQVLLPDFINLTSTCKELRIFYDDEKFDFLFRDILENTEYFLKYDPLQYQKNNSQSQDRNQNQTHIWKQYSIDYYSQKRKHCQTLDITPFDLYITPSKELTPDHGIEWYQDKLPTHGVRLIGALQPQLPAIVAPNRQSHQDITMIFDEYNDTHKLVVEDVTTQRMLIFDTLGGVHLSMDHPDLRQGRLRRNDIPAYIRNYGFDGNRSSVRSNGQLNIVHKLTSFFKLPNNNEPSISDNTELELENSSDRGWVFEPPWTFKFNVVDNAVAVWGDTIYTIGCDSDDNFFVNAYENNPNNTLPSILLWTTGVIGEESAENNEHIKLYGCEIFVNQYYVFVVARQCIAESSERSAIFDGIILVVLRETGQFLGAHEYKPFTSCYRVIEGYIYCDLHHYGLQYSSDRPVYQLLTKELKEFISELDVDTYNDMISTVLYSKDHLGSLDRIPKGVQIIDEIMENCDPDHILENNWNILLTIDNEYPPSYIDDRDITGLLGGQNTILPSHSYKTLAKSFQWMHSNEYFLCLRTVKSISTILDVNDYESSFYNLFVLISILNLQTGKSTNYKLDLAKSRSVGGLICVDNEMRIYSISKPFLRALERNTV